LKLRLRHYSKKVDRPFKKYLCIVYTRGGGYYARMVDNSGPREITTFTVHGHKYAIDMTKAKRLKGWRGTAKDGFWAEFVDVIPSGIGILYYLESEDKHHAIVIPDQPIDRIAELGFNRIDTPEVYNAMVKSPLYRRYQAKLKFGGGVNWLVVVLVMVGLAAVMIILAMSGYFDTGAR